MKNSYLIKIPGKLLKVLQKYKNTFLQTIKFSTKNITNFFVLKSIVKKLYELKQ